MSNSLPAPVQLPSPKMEAFCLAFLARGGKHAGKAARDAGYADSAADAVASRLLRRPDILARLRELASTQVSADVIQAAGVLREIAFDATIQPDIRRKAAESLLDRSGWIVGKLNINMAVPQESREQLIAELVAFAEGLGIPPAKLIGGAMAFHAPNTKPRRPRVLDLDAEQVAEDDAEPEAEPEGERHSSEGIADLL